MDYNSFKEEVKLSVEQNGCVELELYSIVAQLIRDIVKVEKLNISVRDVSARQSSEISKGYKSHDGDIKGFPDFVILKRDGKRKPVLGVIELKSVCSNLDKETEIEQLNRHKKTFDNVIYSNGLEWRFYTCKNSSPKTIVIGNYLKDGTIKWEKDFLFDELVKELRMFFEHIL